MIRPLVGDYPQDIHASTLRAAQDCEARGTHSWHLYDRGETAPHYWCECWNRAEITDPPPNERLIPLVFWQQYAAKWASEGCDFCETMRDSCRRQKEHFSAEHIERRRVSILHRRGIMA